ncbi:PilZ domain-containing protein [Mesorhizobium sp. BAC0120]|uniref:PilZ domain-containing protein n=1 Tax=Mesorhizobium sp. BAC0120 TaxID=3090670 RepID=UPI00298C532E|nr:PilZ domain-containing protein [Mesorhizobium sp. BAC0120]MDW6020666.1 PilZ domain-containing protein [Mesorhizobium sp. BAC0120]
MRVVIDQAARQAYIAEERRSTRRNRVFKGAVVSFNRGHSVFECIVRNQTDAGAKLCMDQTFALPMSFGLSIAGSEGMRIAQVVWRSPNELGVRFQDQS